MNTISLITHLDGVLIPLGFSRQDRTWNRPSGIFIDVVDVQENQAGDSVTINCGVLHLEVHQICWGKDADCIIQEPICTIRARIGDLVDGRDVWWKSLDLAMTQDMADAIAGKVRSTVLPFLEKMHSETEMAAFLTWLQVEKKKYPPPIICLAVLRSRQGKKEVAATILSTLHMQTSEAWRPKVVEAASRLGISIHQKPST